MKDVITNIIKFVGIFFIGYRLLYLLFTGENPHLTNKYK